MVQTHMTLNVDQEWQQVGNLGLITHRRTFVCMQGDVEKSPKSYIIRLYVNSTVWHRCMSQVNDPTWIQCCLIQVHFWQDNLIFTHPILGCCSSDPHFPKWRCGYFYLYLFICLQNQHIMHQDAYRRSTESRDVFLGRYVCLLGMVAMCRHALGVQHTLGVGDCNCMYN